MAYVVLEACINCRYTDCVDVCPVDCFHQGPNLLVIDPEECIDCSLCAPECPVDAIYFRDDIEEDYKFMIEINKKYSKEWPIIECKIKPLSNADQWATVSKKYHLLEED